MEITQAEVDDALNWSYRRVPLDAVRFLDAIPLNSAEEIPADIAELDAAMDAAGIEGPRRQRLRRQFKFGSILFVIGGLFVRSNGRVMDYPRSVLEKAIEEAREEMAADVAELRDGEIDLSEWEARSMRSLRALYLVAAGLGAGAGALAINTALGALTQQYGALAVMASDIATGKQRPGGIFRRIRRYAGFARAVFQAAIVAALDLTEWVEEINVLGVAEHCKECVELSNMGWVPTGTLPPIGSRLCGTECKCGIDRRNRAGLVVRS